MSDDTLIPVAPSRTRDAGRIALIAGAGEFPRAAAATLVAQGEDVVAIGFNGLTSGDLPGDVSRMAWLDLGQIVAMALKLREWEVERLLLLGKFSRSLLFSENTILSLDAEASRLLASDSNRSDDGLMERIADWLESQGFELLEQAVALSSLLVPLGVLTNEAPSERARDDLASGWPKLASLGRSGVGQCVVMKQGKVLIAEAIEGTDEMIRSAGELGATGSTLIKAPRAAQDRRFDLPAIGPGTIRAMVDAGMSALAVEAGATLMLDRETCIAEADRAGLAIWGFDSGRMRN